LEIVDVWLNLKQFDSLTWLMLIAYFTTDLRPCVAPVWLNFHAIYYSSQWSPLEHYRWMDV